MAEGGCVDLPFVAAASMGADPATARDLFVIAQPVITTVTRQAEIALTDKFIGAKKASRKSSSTASNTTNESHDTRSLRSSSTTSTPLFTPLSGTGSKRAAFYWTDSEEALGLEASGNVSPASTGSQEYITASEDGNGSQDDVTVLSNDVTAPKGDVTRSPNDVTAVAKDSSPSKCDLKGPQVGLILLLVVMGLSCDGLGKNG